MDPITAIGLASSIVSFIDFSWSLLTGAKELYESGRRRTKENARISSIVDDLHEYALDLTVGGEGASKHEKALRSLANDCCALSEELVGILQKLEMKRNSRWQSLKKSWEAMRKADNIALLESRLGKYRAQMNTRLLALLSEQQSSIKSQLDNIQNEAEKVSSASATELKDMREDITAILNKVQEMECKDDSSTSDEDETDDGEAQKELFRSLDNIMDRLSRLEDALQVTPKETRVLQHLYFEDMFAREDSINNASEGTFDWIMMDDSEFEGYLAAWDAKAKLGDRILDGAVEKMNESRILLRRWLIRGDGVFHVSGKAGSGKSTLMKFILHHPSMLECLKQWVGNKTLVLASFYFWRSDRQKLQMSLEGLYRSILFGVLRKCPHLIPELFPDQWRTMSTQAANMSFEKDLFRPIKIKEAFEMLMKNPIKSEKFAFCFFIDGLDEYEADPFEHKILARHLRDWSLKSNIKMCVSSRPEIEFLDIFRKDHRINLHELTARDIHRSSQEMFEQDESFPKVKGIYLELLTDLVDMAEGVFLWASLVVKSLLVEVGRDANSERLWQTLRSTPSKLDDVYDGMLNTLNRQDRRTVDYILLLVLTNPFPDPMNAICLSWLVGPEEFRFPGPNYTYSDQAVLRQLDSVQRQLQGLTKGLLNLAPDTSVLRTCPMFSRKVQFFHRTARDYLTTPERNNQLRASFPLYDARQTHSILRMAELSSINTWNVPNVGFLEHYADDILRLTHASATTLQLPVAHMKVFEEVWNLHFKNRAAFVGFNSQVSKPLCYEANVQFLYVAAFWGQVDIVRQALHTSEHRLVEAELGASPKLDVSRLGQPSLLISASCAHVGSEIVPLLFDQGFSSTSLVPLFDTSVFKCRKWASVWIVFVAHLATRSLRFPERGSKLTWSLFDNLESFLNAADQEPVLVLGRKEDVKTDQCTHFATIEQLVVFHKPPNMQALLKLLGRWRTDGVDGGTKILWDSRKWEAFGVVEMPTYQAADSLEHFVLEGVASMREIILDLEFLGFRVY
ncbi:hypothetical protein L207DRAFT_500844 [Hyaloscypha variabilis F]|uniref:NACHT domain-containing protein n=1 Tax=Hyaloscypha variabilis (strain UAMH 11265 / GT02V1 / F) TaxID=1149755 RepID=A0A2J6QZT0_HYAVF|nr:hypothetical protein L207DRAFT_500844 [Hyaloscypha variabilis F]